MAYIIKSDATLNTPANAVGNIHGYYGPQDYRAILDFSHGIYELDGVANALSDLLSFTRASEARYVDVLGRERVAAGNEPRIHAIKESGVVGLLLERAHENYCTGDADGATFSATASGLNLCLSWSGTGSVSIAGLTLIREVVEAGRTNRFYTRSGAVAGTITVTGTVQNVMVTNSAYAPAYVPHGVNKPDDLVQFAAPLLGLVSGGTGTLLARFALLSDDGNDNRDVDMFSLYNSSAPQGGISTQVGYKYSGLGTGEVQVHPDGAAMNGGTQVARNLGNRPQTMVEGVYFDGFGATAGIMCYGQAGKGIAVNEGATPPTAFDQVNIGRLAPGVVSSSTVAGLVLTHLVIYDRMVSDTEADGMALFGAR